MIAEKHPTDRDHFNFAGDHCFEAIAMIERDNFNFARDHCLKAAMIERRNTRALFCAICVL